MPSDRELRQIRSYREFWVTALYNPGYAKKILAKPLPEEDGHNTLILRKGASHAGTEDHWFKRKISWENPVYVPHVLEKEYRGLSLVDVLDVEQSLIPVGWERWKTEHPDIFP